MAGNTQAMDESAPQKLRNDIEMAILTRAQLGGASATDADALLRLIDAASGALEECVKLQKDAVHQARRADISWAAIGEVMGTTRQAAQQRFAPEQSTDSPAGNIRKVYGPTAFNEMQILATEGRAGNHLVGFGALFLSVKPSNHVWEHRRETSLTIGGRRTQLENAGWIYVGSWFPFRYFKRIKS